MENLNRDQVCASLGLCSDLDDDCYDIEDKWACWEHDEARGHCPFLSVTAGTPFVQVLLSAE